MRAAVGDPQAAAIRRARIGAWAGADAACALAALGLGLVPARAHAHDPPHVLQIVWRPDSRVLLQTNRGLIFGDSERGPWRLMCNEALPVTTTERSTLTYTSAGRLLVATSRGLKVSDDEGCSWQVLAFGDRLVPALAAHPEQPDRVYVTTFQNGAASAETSGRSAIQVSDDGGESWSSLRVVPDNDYIHSLAIAASDPNRVYATGTVYQDGRAFYVLRSEDAGTSWERFDVEIDDAEYDLLLLGVSPVDPDLVLARVAAGEPDMMEERLLLSRDGGESWQTVTQIMKLRAAAFSADGATLWLAGRDGLYRSSGDLSAFERVGEAEEMTSAVEHDGALIAGGWHAGLDQGAPNNGVGKSSDSGDSFEPWMAFQDVSEPIACDVHSATTPMLCAQLWSDWEYEILRMFGAVAPDAGAQVGDAGAPRMDAEDGGAGDGSMRFAGREIEWDSGCQVAPGRGGRGGAVALWIGLVLGAVKGRRKMDRRGTRGERLMARGAVS